LGENGVSTLSPVYTFTEPALTLQRFAVPSRQIRRRFVCRFKKFPERHVGIRLCAQVVILQQELAQRCVVAGCGWSNFRPVQPGRSGSRGAIKRCVAKPPFPGQKPALITSCEYASRITASSSGRSGARRPENRVTAR